MKAIMTVAVALILLLGCFSSAGAETYWRATMTSAQYPDAWAEVFFWLDDTATSWDYVIQYSGLQGATTSCKVYLGTCGAALGTPRYTLVNSNFPTGYRVDDAVFDPAHLGELQGGQLVCRIFTTVNPIMGEACGVIVSAPTPVENATWGKVRLLYR